MSPPKSHHTKKFMHHGIPITWETIERCYARDKLRNTQITPLTYKSVFPDRYNKMTVSLAKHAFHPDTIAEITCHLWNVLEQFNVKCDHLWNMKENQISNGDNAMSNANIIKKS